MNFSSRHIVIVEDEVALGQICQELLTTHGYKATFYSTAVQALKETENVHIDLLITDVGLADKSGYEFVAELNNRCKLAGQPEVPVIFISGAFLPQINSGNSFYLEKPFSIYTLLKQVRTIFDSQEQKQQAG